MSGREEHDLKRADHDDIMEGIELGEEDTEREWLIGD